MLLLVKFFQFGKMEHFCQRQDHMIPRQERQKLQNYSQHRLLNQKLTNILEIHYNPIRIPTSFLLYFADGRRAWTDYFAQCACSQCFARGSPGGVASRSDLQSAIRSVQWTLFCAVTALRGLHHITWKVTVKDSSPWNEATVLRTMKLTSPVSKAVQNTCKSTTKPLL